MKTQSSEFLKAHKKVKSGKKKLSDKDFIKYKSTKADNLNSLGKFFVDEKISLQELNKIAEEYNNETYKLHKYTCVVLPKGIDSYRPILVPHPRDRILFSYILETIKEPFLDEINKYKVFGSGKRTDFPNIKKIIEEIQKESKKHKFILKLDICKFFPSIDQKTLFKKMNGCINTPYISKLIKDSFNNEISIRYTKEFTEEKKKEIEASIKKGIPQGTAYSPLLANFYTLEFDSYTRSKNLVSFRYLDDMIIFTNSKEEAENVFNEIKKIADNLKLQIHDIDKKIKNKTYIQQSNHTFEYLGIEVKSDGTFQIPLVKIKKEIFLIKNGIFSKLSIRKFGVDNVMRVFRLQLNGWRSYYKRNFPSAYESMQNRETYNKDLKDYYTKVFNYSKKNIKDQLILNGFDINDINFYL